MSTMLNLIFYKTNKFSIEFFYIEYVRIKVIISLEKGKGINRIGKLTWKNKWI
jgi:hypothetical protein